MDSTTTKSNIQKKMLVYARDIALEKLNKKLEKKIAKQQIRKQQNDGALHERSAEDSDFVRTSSEFASSSSEIIPLVHSNEKLASSSVNSSNSETKLLNKNSAVLAQSVTSINSSGQDESYETADEDDEEVPTNKDLLQTSRKPSEINGIPKTNDFIVEISEDNNDKLVVKPTLPAHAPANSSGSVDYSGYIQKKSLAQGMMDLALVSANTNQLRYIIEYKEHHPYFVTSLSLVIASLFLQLAVGLTLIWNTRFNMKKRKEMQEADKVNNFSVIGIFIVTLINVFLSTFGGAPQPGGGGGGGSTEAAQIPSAIESHETVADDPTVLH